jgi:hypothetical protein
LAKAASLGANTVRGPLPERVSTSPHAVTAAVVEKVRRYDLDIYLMELQLIVIAADEVNARSAVAIVIALLASMIVADAVVAASEDLRIQIEVDIISQRKAKAPMINLPTRVLKVPAPTAVSTMLAIWRLDCGW